MKLNGLIIADIHFRTTGSERLLNELRRIFLHQIETTEKLDFIAFLGDYFDSKIYMSSDTANASIYFMDEVVRACKKRKDNPKIRIIDGTGSHDAGQLKIFEPYRIDSDIDFRIIYNVEEEELFPDINVLYIPEEYVTNKTEYYKEYLSKEKYYDLIFGHGVIQEVMSYMKTDTKESERRKAAVFTVGELMYACKGHTYFGHYHSNVAMKDAVYYVGSFSRWIHGEEEPKGFYKFNMDSKKELYENEFIENTLAQKYTTFYYGYNSEIFKDREFFFREFDYIESVVKDELIDYIRVVINIPDDYAEAEFIVNYINTKFATIKRIKVELTNGYIDKKQKIDRQKIKDVYEKFGYMFDKQTPLAVQAHKFIETEYQIDIPVERIEKHLFEEIEGV